MKRATLVLLAGLTVMVATPVLGGAAVLAALLGGGGGEGLRVAAGSSSAMSAIPASMLVTYQTAASACPGLSWTVLAAIGTVESENGQSTLPGVRSGHNPAGAEGPMQFEPATFQRYDLPVPPGGVTPPSPYDPVDAVYAAARMLCANGVAAGARLRAAIFAYNHSDVYVNQVLALAGQLGAGIGLIPSAWQMAGAATASAGWPVAVAFAWAQLGTPYRWGGETAGVAFDCSGLVQAAWATAGVHLPRVAQQQFEAGPLLAPGSALQPGDLVFFGPAGGGVTHVGLVVDPSGQMVDAPHTGASVRVEPFPLTVGATWGGDIYIGATRPGLV